MRRPANGIYLIRTLGDRWQCWCVWRGHIIAGGFCSSHDRAVEMAAAIKAQLASVPVLDQADDATAPETSGAVA